MIPFLPNSPIFIVSGSIIPPPHVFLLRQPADSIWAYVPTPQLLQDVVNHYFYQHPVSVAVGIGVRNWFILHPVYKKLLHYYPMQHQEFSDQY